MRASRLRLALTAILSLAALPALVSAVSVPNAEPACQAFLTSLDLDDSLNACIAPINNATVIYQNSTSKAATTASLTPTLQTLCASDGLVAQCDEAAVRKNLFNFWGSCQNDIVKQTPGVYNVYDFLYVLIPFKKAICQTDTANNYCLLNVAAAVGQDTSAAQRRSQIDEQQQEEDEDAKDVDVTNAPVELGEDEEDEDDNDIDVTTSSVEQRKRYHAGLAARLRTRFVAKRQSDYEISSEAGQEDNSTKPNNNIAFLFVQPSSSKDILCSECTRNILASYIQFEISVPYAVGLSSSLFLRGQSALYAKTKEVCGTSFADDIDHQSGVRTKMGSTLHYDEVAKHNSNDDCWVIVHGEVWDVTDFLPDHPGGSKIILKYAGKDATEEYEPIHPPGTLQDNLPKDKLKGKVDPATIPKEVATASAEKKISAQEALEKNGEIPPLELCLNLYDFEVIAKRVLKPAAWAYYSSGADDEVTMRDNARAFGRIWFRPRILRNVSAVNYSTTLLGHKSSMPIYITATALGKLGHPDGEKNLTIAAGHEDIIQMIPTLASCSFDEIVDARVHPGQVQFLQLYVNSKREQTEKIVKNAEARGVKALFITVDAPQLGRREKDMRMKFDDVGSRVQNDSKDNVDRSQGAARAISSFIDPSLNWDDIPWLRSLTRMPLILKGVQTWEDAVLAAERGLNGVVLSNHGGRQLDYARSGIEVLPEVVDALTKRGLFPNPQFQIFVDGGVRRASDVLKAVALGATAVGIGRPFLYAYSAGYGWKGVQHAIRLLKAEMEMNMRLIGAPNLRDLVPEMVDIRALGLHTSDVPSHTGGAIYQKMATAVGMPDEPSRGKL
ncbi:unnamed protein product [Tilletia caries]|nr:unnamed protein product [Tilletia caries]